MKHILLNMLLLAFLGATAHGAPLLTPEPERITDRAIGSDIQAVNGLQKRLAELNAKGTPIGSYHFAKAQAWLDMAMDQYAMNDRTRVIEDALWQALLLIEQLEAGKGSPGMETPLLPTSTRLRPDLWRTADELKRQPGFSCGEDLVARLEVQLVWAGHEENQLGWRHAKPYLQAAERLAGDARRLIEACPDHGPTPAGAVEVRDELKPVPPACPSCPAPAAVGGAQPARSAAPAGGEDSPDRVHFAVNSDFLSPRSAAVLERLAVVLRADPDLKLELQGHADERGGELFNQALSLRRAQVVRTYLLAAGVERSRIMVRAFGVSRPEMRGRDIVSFAHNRRVEFVLTGGDGQLRPIRQDQDLQVERRRGQGR